MLSLTAAGRHKSSNVARKGKGCGLCSACLPPLRLLGINKQDGFVVRCELLIRD